MTGDPAYFAPWNPFRDCRSYELDRLSVPSGRLAIRDVYDMDRPQVELNVVPGDHRVWSTEFNIHTNQPRTVPVYRPAYLSIQLCDMAPHHISTPEDLYAPKPLQPNGVSVYTQLGMVLLHDADSVSVEDFESLDMKWEQAWESADDYSEVHTSTGSRIITCKTLMGNTRCPILASYDEEGNSVAIHVDFEVIDTDGTARWAAQVDTARRWGTKTGRMFPWLFRTKR